MPHLLSQPFKVKAALIVEDPPHPRRAICNSTLDPMCLRPLADLDGNRRRRARQVLLLGLFLVWAGGRGGLAASFQLQQHLLAHDNGGGIDYGAGRTWHHDAGRT